MRFLKTGWGGDMYGRAHSTYLGMIWLYSFIVFIPWSFFLNKISFSKENLYTISWLIFPLLFFTFSRNIVWTYGVWMCVPMSLLIYDKIKYFNVISKASLLTLFVSIIICASPIVTWKEKELTKEFKGKTNVIVKGTKEHIITFHTNGTVIYK